MAVTLLNTNTNFKTLNTLTPSGAQTVNTGGTNVVAVAHITFTAISLSSISATYGSVAMTSAGAAVSNGNDRIAMFVLVNPPTGSNTLAITISATSVVDCYADITTFQGADQTTPIRASSYTTATGTSASASISIPSATGDIVTDTLLWGSSAATPSLTQINQDRSGTVINFGDSYGSGATTVTDTWTISSQGWGLGGFSLQAAAAAISDPPFSMYSMAALLAR